MQIVVGVCIVDLIQNSLFTHYHALKQPNDRAEATAAAVAGRFILKASKRTKTTIIKK